MDQLQEKSKIEYTVTIKPPYIINIGKDLIFEIFKHVIGSGEKSVIDEKALQRLQLTCKEFLEISTRLSSFDLIKRLQKLSSKTLNPFKEDSINEILDSFRSLKISHSEES